MTRKNSDTSGSRVKSRRVGTASVSAARRLVQRAGQLARRSDRASLDQAVALLRRAASEGSREAEYAIGTWYGFGKCLPQDDRKAVKYFKRAARKKHPAALFNLGYSYEVGRGLTEDPARAFNMYVEAARAGDRDAISEVYRCLFWGIGVTRNRPLAKLIVDLGELAFARKRRARGQQ